jgi:benzoyl-CoA 2,3-dioxygenase component A
LAKVATVGRDEGAEIARQHVIDPEICIRCNTCEETCPVDAVTHDARNYVVDFNICESCGACIAPCPTGAIDNWRNVSRARPYTLAEQFSWDSLPTQADLGVNVDESLPEDVRRLTDEARAGQGGAAPAPRSAETPKINLYRLSNPATATVTGNYRLTDDNASAQIHHIILDFGGELFPVLEGQSIGVLPPGTDASGKPHHIRLYSIASPRDGEKPNHNNLSLTVKRVTQDHQGKSVVGVASNYLCDLKKGDQVRVVGPYGSTFLMPNHSGSSLLMICTGTGSAPMRAMTERRRRRLSLKEGGTLTLFFGARRPGELPYFGPLTKLPPEFIDVNFAFSREPGTPKTYVQDLIRARGDHVARLLRDKDCYIYICGLRGMEDGVRDAFREVCVRHGVDWDSLHPQLLSEGRFHVETY